MAGSDSTLDRRAAGGRRRDQSAERAAGGAGSQRAAAPEDRQNRDRQAGDTPGAVLVRTGLLRRLARIEGQVRGVARMMEQDRTSVDVLNQLAAAQQGLRQVSRELLARHLRASIEDAFESGDRERKAEATREITDLMFKYSR
jgi:DNA-binding FrmR family transcriptional regulator